ncbi:hypothetical protein ACHAP5_010965 [Fusarium lateritium]
MLLLSLLALRLPLAVAAATAEPCALVTKQISENADSSGSGPAVVPAQLAQDCLDSMPFYPELAVSFIDELSKYIQWQSTLEVLQDPPKTYSSSSTDILGGLEEIRQTNYSSQWEFDRAIDALIDSANDGHFYVRLCSSNIFTFIRTQTPLVSVSKNGLDAPEIYTYTDALLLNNTNVKVSPITSIDDQDPVKYLDKITAAETYQDPDARYNKMFWSLPTAADPFEFGSFYKNALFSGRNTTALEFRNGSTIEVPMIATVSRNFGYESGDDLFDRLCRSATTSDTPGAEPTTSPDSNDAEASVDPTFNAGPEYLPEPFVRDPYNQMVGYYLDEDTVVMLIPSFDGSNQPANYSTVFAEYATEIVSQALKSGRTKIIIDLSSNTGGNISRSFDLFKLFFPRGFPYSATRFRRHRASEDTVKVFSALNDILANQIGGPLPLASQVKPDQEDDFTSYQEFLGNKTELGVKVSSLYANFNYTQLSGQTDQAPIRGYGGRPDIKEQPFRPEDILIIGDGICASTCTTFVNLMTNVGGVQALSFGGKPNDKPMQIMGGVRGAQSMGFADIYKITQRVQTIYINNPGKFDFITEDEIKEFADNAPRSLEEFPIVLSSGNVNLRNAYQEGDDDLPLQFQYQAADCRLYFTSENILRPETTWASAKAAIWGNGTCIEGSTGGKGSLKDKESKDDKAETPDDKGKKGSDGADGEDGEDGKTGDSSSGAIKAVLGWRPLAAAFVVLVLAL